MYIAKMMRMDFMIYARLQSVADIIGQICKLIGRYDRQKRADEAEDERNDNGLVPRL